MVFQVLSVSCFVWCPILGKSKGGLTKGGLSPKFSEKIGGKSFLRNRAFSGQIGTFSGPIGAFSGPIGTNSSAPHSHGGRAEIAPKGPFLAQLAPFGPSPPLLSPPLDFPDDRHVMAIAISAFLIAETDCLLELHLNVTTDTAQSEFFLGVATISSTLMGFFKRGFCNLDSGGGGWKADSWRGVPGVREGLGKGWEGWGRVGEGAGYCSKPRLKKKKKLLWRNTSSIATLITRSGALSSVEFSTQALVWGLHLVFSGVFLGAMRLAKIYLGEWATAFGLASALTPFFSAEDREPTPNLKRQEKQYLYFGHYARALFPLVRHFFLKSSRRAGPILGHF